MYELFLTCPKGLERVCKKDIEHIDLKKYAIFDGGVSFEGSLKDPTLKQSWKMKKKSQVRSICLYIFRPSNPPLIPNVTTQSCFML